MSDVLGILLVNTGEPESPKVKDVRRYLRNHLADPRISHTPSSRWSPALNLSVLPQLSRERSAKYVRLWTDQGSPYQLTHETLERALNAYYAQTGCPVVVRIGMTFGNPSIASALLSLRAEGVTKLIVLPLYPQSAYSTTEAARDALVRAFRGTGWSVPYTFIDDYGKNPTYIRAIAASIQRQGLREDADDRLLFVYRSVPLADIEAGDDYELKVDASSLDIANELNIERKRWSIAFFRGFDEAGSGLKPYAVDMLARWAERPGGTTFLVCPNFAVDCLETLYDIPYELLPAFISARREAGLPYHAGDFVYVPCLGKSKAHLRVLTDVIGEYMPGGTNG